MKKTVSLIVLMVFLVEGYARSPKPAIWTGDEKPGLWDYWSLELNMGAMSYFGDLSLYDADPFNKLTKESGPAFSMILTKHFKHKFGISGQILYGGFQSDYSNELSFSTNVLEYNLQARVDLINLFSSRKSHKFGLTMFGGVGQFIFKSVEHDGIPGEQEKKVNNSRVPELVLLFGGGMHYHISQRITVSTSLSVRQARNDKLDNKVKNNNFDYYTYFNVGIAYNINNLLGNTRKKNLANTQFPYGKR
jgi:hypothetical protein